VSPDEFSSVEISQSLRLFLARLPEVQRRLVESLYWEGKTEVEVARLLSLCQPVISRRKRRILEQLRRWLDRSEKRDSSED
jgi:RNA polymerase sigma factor (sigma-70 family)